VSKIDLSLKLSATVVLLGAVVALGGTTIAQLGTLIHFNCRPHGSKVTCELTREPLIGDLQTRYLEKSALVKTGTIANGSRLMLVTKSQGTIPFTLNRSLNANQQLLAQRDQLDQFLASDKADTLYVRTHRPGFLWVILGGLAIAAVLLAIMLGQLALQLVLGL
jgi:hypothetical protein